LKCRNLLFTVNVYFWIRQNPKAKNTTLFARGHFFSIDFLCKVLLGQYFVVSHRERLARLYNLGNFVTLSFYFIIVPFYFYFTFVFMQQKIIVSKIPTLYTKIQTFVSFFAPPYNKRLHFKVLISPFSFFRHFVYL
jgi:hypothetical protein